MAKNAKQLNPLWQAQSDAGRQALGAYSPMLQWAMQNAGLQMPQQPMGQMGQPMGQQAMPSPMGQAPTASRFPGGGGGSGFEMKPSPQAQFAASQAGGPMASVQPLGGSFGGMGQSPMGQSPQSASPNFGQAGRENSELGIYGSNPADVYRMQQAEEEINRISGQRRKLLEFRLGQQGIGGSGTMAAALGQNERSAMSDLANFRRQLAINAGPEQERRMQLLAQMLGLGAGQGAQGQSVYGQQQQISASKPTFLNQLTQVAGAAAPFFMG